jgi:S-methylmethionine-dependent homocysteine/selenocysteine methylase
LFKKKQLQHTAARTTAHSEVSKDDKVVPCLEQGSLMEALTAAFQAGARALPPSSNVAQLIHIRQAVASGHANRLPFVPVLLDGGLATEFERRGLDTKHPMWSTKALMDDADKVSAVHRDFYAAGADVVATATYQASVAGAERCGTSMTQIAADAVRAARKASEDCHRFDVPLLVAGSLGPYGATLGGGAEYTGDYALSHDELVAFHTPRVEALVAAGVDLLLLETFPRLDEAKAALTAVANVFDNVQSHHRGGGTDTNSDQTVPRSLPPVSLSFTLRSPRDDATTSESKAGDAGGSEIYTSAGDPIDDAVALASSFNFVRWIGANCCAPEMIDRLLTQWSEEASALRRQWLQPADQQHGHPPHTHEPAAVCSGHQWADIPRGLAFYPNSGERWVGQSDACGTGRWDASHLPPEEAKIGGRLAAHWPRWRAMLERAFRGYGGTVLVGGCCRTYPEDIRALADAIEKGR